jgi:hypothetical protein
MKRGEIFVTEGGKIFAFDKISSGGCILAYDKSRQATVRFPKRSTAAILEMSSGKIDGEALEILRNKDEDIQNKRQLVHQLKKGDKFLGVDGKQYYFVRMNKTRFVLTKDLNSYVEYNAKPGFIKKLL